MGILVQHLSIEDLVTVWILQPSTRDRRFRADVPNDQSGGGSDELALSKRILGHRGDWEGELSEAWGGGNGDHCLEARREEGGRKRGNISASMGRVYKERRDPQDDPFVQESLHPTADPRSPVLSINRDSVAEAPTSRVLPPPTEPMTPDQRLDDLSQVGHLRSSLSPLIPAPDHRLHPSYRSRRAPPEQSFNIFTEDLL